MASVWKLDAGAREQLFAAATALATTLMAGVKPKTKEGYSRTVRRYQLLMQFLGLDPRKVNLDQWIIYAVVMTTKRSPPIIGATIVQHLSHMSTASGWMVISLEFPAPPPRGSGACRRSSPKSGRRSPCLAR